MSGRITGNILAYIIDTQLGQGRESEWTDGLLSISISPTHDSVVRVVIDKNVFHK